VNIEIYAGPPPVKPLDLPSAHPTGFGRAGVTVISAGRSIGTTESMRMRPGEAFFGGGDGFDSLLKLCRVGSRAARFAQCPSIILRVGNLHALGCELLDERDHLFEVIDVLAMDDKVYR